tara:strand:- start:936 stop:1115 length:180 start_codon:yes stop_codon:yes gene_type:complete
MLPVPGGRRMPIGARASFIPIPPAHPDTVMPASAAAATKLFFIFTPFLIRLKKGIANIL